MVCLLVALQLGRPADTEDSDAILAVGHNGFTLLSTRTYHFVLLGACWEEGLAEEVVYIWRAAQVGHRHEWLERDKFNYDLNKCDSVTAVVPAYIK